MRLGYHYTVVSDFFHVVEIKWCDMLNLLVVLCYLCWILKYINLELTRLVPS